MRPLRLRISDSRPPTSFFCRFPIPTWPWPRPRSDRFLKAKRPSLRIANLSALRHPMSVDLFADTTLKGTKAVLIRLLGGLDYWRYGGEQLGRRCRELGIALAIVPGDGRPDIRLAALSTVNSEDLMRFEALLDVGGVENTRAALKGLLWRAENSVEKIPEPRVIPGSGIYRESAARSGEFGTAALIFYRSHLLAGDVAPIDALVDALDQRGLATTALYVPSLKAPDAAAWLQRELARLSPRCHRQCDGVCGSRWRRRIAARRLRLSSPASRACEFFARCLGEIAARARRFGPCNARRPAGTRWATVCRRRFV